MLFAAALLFAPAASAHSGMVSPKDGCHNQKATGTTHWHFEESKVIGGPCLRSKVGGPRIQYLTIPRTEMQKLHIEAEKVRGLKKRNRSINKRLRKERAANKKNRRTASTLTNCRAAVVKYVVNKERSTWSKTAKVTGREVGFIINACSAVKQK